MKRRDLAAALHHLDRLCAERWNPHRAELERILLALIKEAEDEEHTDYLERRRNLN